MSLRRREKDKVVNPFLTCLFTCYKDRDGQLTSLQLVGMARGVACGMVYLSEKKNLIHRVSNSLMSTTNTDQFLFSLPSGEQKNSLF